MKPVSLCEYCSRINFDALRLPLTSDIEDLRQGKIATDSLFFEKRDADETHKITSLGSLSRILSNSQKCALCRLFGQILTRRAGYPTSGLTSNGEEILCQAETNFYGLFRNPSDVTKFYWLRRLSIIARAREDDLPHGAHFAFQACDAGAASMRPDESALGPGTNDDKMMFGGRKRPLLLDLRWVQKWLQICDEDHGSACRLTGNQDHVKNIPLIRFIDVQQKSLVTFTDADLSNIKFVALSYVWGASQRLTLKTSNANAFALPGALASDLVSGTVADAMYLVQNLAVPYLWVDACCILQDSEIDKKAQISAMNGIYSASCLTVIGASGKDADAGLPGLRAHSRSLEQEEIVIPLVKTKSPSAHKVNGAQLSLLTTLNPLKLPAFHYLEGTTWDSRGWTMQERVLSRRVLIFTQEQVFWVCNEATFCEESYFEHSIRFSRFHGSALELTLQRSFRNFYDSEDPQDRFWAQYQDFVRRFTRRRFTYGGDIHDGFSAILQAMSGLSNERFLWGLPRSRFEIGLAWTTFTGQYRRTELSTLPMTSKNIRVSFPSWSWMGWVGEAWVSVGDDRAELGNVPEIICFVHSTTPVQIRGVRLLSNEEYPTVPVGMQERAAWQPVENVNVGIDEIATHFPELFGRLESIPGEHLLFFWTSSAVFTVDYEHKGVGDKPRILDNSATCVGETDRKLALSVKLGGGGGSRHSDEQRLIAHEFVVIGSVRGPISDFKPELVVLQIEWNEGIAYRTNIGRIKEDAWIAADFQWKLIVLGDLNDLGEAIRLGQLVSDATSEDLPERVTHLYNQAGRLRTRFSRTGDLKDIDKAIRFGQLALDAVPDGPPSRSRRLNDLGSSFRERFLRTGHLKDSEESIRLGQLALDATPEDHPYRARHLNNLGTRFEDRFSKKGHLGDLEEAIRLVELALDKTPDEYSDRAGYLDNLGTRFRLRFARTGEQEDLEKSTRILLQSSYHSNGIPLKRISAGLSAAKNLMQLSKWDESATTLQDALNLLPKVALRTSSRRDLQHNLRNLSGAASLAASVFLKAERSPFEVLQILEQGRGVIAGLVIDSRSDVSLLKTEYQDLYSQYIQLREIVAMPLSSDLSQEDTSVQATTLRDTYASQSLRRNRAAEDLEKVLQKIREQPGFERFQLAPTEKEILDLASSGPLVSFNISSISAEAFIITRGGVDVLQLPHLKEMDLNSTVSVLASRGNSNGRDATIVSDIDDSGGIESVPETHLDISSKLFLVWENAVKPVLGELGLLGQKSPRETLPRIWRVGGGLMAILPLHAVGEHSPGSTENTLSHVISSFAPTLKSLQFARSRPWRSLKERNPQILVVSMPETPGLPGHLNVAEEVTAIKATVGRQGSVTALEQPSKSEVLEQFRSSTIAHFACHGRADALEPAKSALLLGKTSIEELTIGDLDMVHNSHAQIAYLSACSTAEIKGYYLLDESIHLASTFLLTGFPHVIGTLWGANDSAAVVVASEFYKEIFKESEEGNMSVAFALHKAVSHLKTTDNSADILKWAPFIHIGP